MKLARRLSKAYLRLIRRSRVARRASIGVLLLAILALGPPWVVAFALLSTALALVAMLAIRDGLFDPFYSNKIDDDWF
jgi:hypothetical protein